MPCSVVNSLGIAKRIFQVAAGLFAFLYVLWSHNLLNKFNRMLQLSSKISKGIPRINDRTKYGMLCYQIANVGLEGESRQSKH